MSQFGRANYCCICEKTIPHSARCVYCRRGLCRTCRCRCPLSQPKAIPINPKTGGIQSGYAGSLKEDSRGLHVHSVITGDDDAA